MGLSSPERVRRVVVFAGAVGADEGDHLVGVDAEGDAFDGFDLAVGDAEVLDLEQCGHRVSSSSVVVVSLGLVPVLATASASAASTSATSSAPGAPSKGVPR